MGAPDLDTDAKYTLKLIIGNEKKYKVVLVDGDQTPVQLTDTDVLKLAIKKDANDDDIDAIFLKDIPLTGQPPADLLNGIARFTLSAADTGGITETGRFKWDIRVERSAGSTPKNVPDPAGEVVISYPIRRA